MENRSSGLAVLVPNVITCIGLSAGLVAVFLAMRGDCRNAAWLVLLCVLLDKLDGAVARLMGGGSELGVQLDSFSDFTTFMVAPAVIYVSAFTAAGSPFAAAPRSLLVYGSALVYVVAGAARLARFNCQTDAGALPKKYFIGLPTTMAGAVGASLFLTLDGHLAPAAYAFVFPPLLLLFALLMVCRLYLPKLGRRNSRAVTWFQLVHLFVAPLLVLFRTLPEYLLFLALLYVVVGFVAANRRGVEIS